jgi:hypothetical protein
VPPGGILTIDLGRGGVAASGPVRFLQPLFAKAASFKLG